MEICSPEHSISDVWFVSPVLACQGKEKSVCFDWSLLDETLNFVDLLISLLC